MKTHFPLLALALLVACGPVDEDLDGKSGDNDCNDNDNLVFRGAEEICDGVDNDCDGVVDNDYATGGFVFYVDGDGDGYGAVKATAVGCTAPEGFVSNASDCDDAAASVNPRADEICNGVDEDCDGKLDDNAVDAPDWHADWDQDGFGSATLVVRECEAPEGFISDAQDCNDFDYFTNPTSDEVCDYADNNCDGVIDEDTAIDAREWYADVDGDGYGNAEVTQMACWQPASFSADATDCNDADGRTNPGSPEICRDGADNNCNGSPDQCSPSGWVDVRDASVTWVGPTGSGSAYLGYETTFVGDMNGDGFEDAAIGAYYMYAGSNYGAGAAFIMYGEEGGTYEVGETRDATDSPYFLGNGSYQYSGRSIAGAGDVNGDGYDDMLVGAYGANSYRGRVYLILGQADMYTGSNNLVDYPYWEGTVTYEYMGYDAAGVSDLNGDGFGELAFGSYQKRSYAGEVYLVAGATDIAGDSSEVVATWYGNRSSSYLGYDASISGGDINGDGYGDLAMGAYYGNGTTTYTGAAWVYYGDGTTPSGTNSVDSLDTWLKGESTYVYFGRGIEVVPDLNDDGYGDLTVGCYGCNGSSNGAYYVWFGDAAELGEQLTSDADAVINADSGQYIGRNEAAVGDLDGDGTMELVMSGYYANVTGFAGQGGVFAITAGSSFGGEYFLSEDSFADIGGPPSTYRYFGYNVGVGDWNGDGYADVVSGSYAQASYAGEAYIFEGTSL